MKEKRGYLKWVSRGSVLVCLGTIALIGIFWRRIPERIPTHYNWEGAVDSWGDKTSLILLVVVMLFLLGMMKITEYFLKTGAESKSTSESEKEQYSAVYPMIVWMDFLMELMFAYILFCSAAARTVGKWFLLVCVIGISVPVVYYLIIRRRRGDAECVDSEKGKITRKELREIYAQQEALESGEVYRTKIDWWLGLILGSALLLPFGILLEVFMEEGRIEWVTLFTGILIIVMCVPMFFIRYTLYADHIKIDVVIYGKERIPYKDITGIKSTHNPLSSAAMSLDRVQIDYVKNGRHEMTMISPVRKKEFIQKLEKYAGLT
ncbi:PH domain-containing protein [Roseburia hominis]